MTTFRLTRRGTAPTGAGCSGQQGEEPVSVLNQCWECSLPASLTSQGAHAQPQGEEIPMRIDGANRVSATLPPNEPHKMLSQADLLALQMRYAAEVAQPRFGQVAPARWDKGDKIQQKECLAWRLLQTTAESSRVGCSTVLCNCMCCWGMNKSRNFMKTQCYKSTLSIGRRPDVIVLKHNEECVAQTHFSIAASTTLLSTHFWWWLLV